MRTAIPHRARRTVVLATLVAVTAAAWGALPQPAAVAATDTTALGGPGIQSIEAVTPVAGGFLAAGSSSGVAAAWHASATGSSWRRLAAPETLAVPGEPGSSVMGLATADTGTVVGVGYEIELPANPKPGGYPIDALFWRAADGGDLVLAAKQTYDGDDYVGATAVAFGDGTFAAVGNHEAPSGNPACAAPIAWYSDDDGSSWTSADLPIPDGAGGAVHAITWSPQFGFVAVGETYETRCRYSSHATGALWTSTDGQVWTPSTDAPDGYSLRGVAATTDRVVVVGAGANEDASLCHATYWSSSDLGAWRATDPDPTEQVNGVTALADGSFVGFGSTCPETTRRRALAYTSTNGNRWTLVHRDKKSAGLTEMFAGAPKWTDGFVIVGAEREDGAAWWT